LLGENALNLNKRIPCKELESEELGVPKSIPKDL
jgi:hypothetical protein